MAELNSADPLPPAAPDPGELDALWQRFVESPAPLTLADVETIEQGGPFDRDSSRIRRAALALLTKSGGELVDIVRNPEGRSVAEEVGQALEGYREALAGLSELMTQAAERLNLALCEPLPE